LAPKIESPSLGTGNTEPESAELRLWIRPGGLETSWEAWIEAEGAGTAVEGGSGSIPASKLEQEVTVKFSGLQPAHRYGWWIHVSNKDGTAGASGTFETFPPLPPGCPTGCGPGAPFEHKPESWVIEAVERAGREAPQREAERQAKKKHEEEEAAAKERALREEGERAGREAAERERLAALAHRVHCVVPHLKGDSLAHAKRALRRAHCSLGRVRHARGADSSVVTAQSVHPGRELASGGAVAVTLGPQPARRRT
jgi:hypothetical protein